MGFSSKDFGFTHTGGQAAVILEKAKATGRIRAGSSVHGLEEVAETARLQNSTGVPVQYKPPTAPVWSSTGHHSTLRAADSRLSSRARISCHCLAKRVLKTRAFQDGAAFGVHECCFGTQDKRTALRPDPLPEDVCLGSRLLGHFGRAWLAVASAPGRLFSPSQGQLELDSFQPLPGGASGLCATLNHMAPLQARLPTKLKFSSGFGPFDFNTSLMKSASVQAHWVFSSSQAVFRPNGLVAPHFIWGLLTR